MICQNLLMKLLKCLILLTYYRQKMLSFCPLCFQMLLLLQQTDSR